MSRPTKEELQARLNDLKLNENFSCYDLLNHINKEKFAKLYEKFVDKNLWNFDTSSIFRDHADEDEIKEAEKNGEPIFDNWDDYWFTYGDDYLNNEYEELESFTSPIQLIGYLRSISSEISKETAITSGFMSNNQYNEFEEIYRDASIFDFAV